MTIVRFAGVVLFVYGLLGLLVNAEFPRGEFADGTVSGESWLGIEVNGWTNFFALAGGGLLLLASGALRPARSAAVLVGALAAACCAIALIDGDDILGLAAANWATALAFGVTAAVLVLAALVSRRDRVTERATAGRAARRGVGPTTLDQPLPGPGPNAEVPVVQEGAAVRYERAAPQEAPAVEEQGRRGARPSTVIVRERRRPGLRHQLRQLTRR